MRAIKLPWKVARTLQTVLGDVAEKLPNNQAARECVRALDAALKPRKGASPAKARRVAKKATRREKVAGLYARLVARSDGFCECGCGRYFQSYPLTMDHFHGGSNRKALESLEGCWMLADVYCHRQKTAGRPSREWWLRRFLAHSERYGYFAEPQRKARAELDNLIVEGRATP